MLVCLGVCPGRGFRGPASRVRGPRSPSLRQAWCNPPPRPRGRSRSNESAWSTLRETGIRKGKTLLIDVILARRHDDRLGFDARRTRHDGLNRRENTRGGTAHARGGIPSGSRGALPRRDTSSRSLPTRGRSETFTGLLKSVPRDQLLLETDCPYLALEPGERNESANVAWHLPLRGGALAGKRSRRIEAVRAKLRALVRRAPLDKSDYSGTRRA